MISCYISYMGPEDKAMLIDIKKQLDENTVMLKKILKQNQIALWSKVGYWAFIILLTVGAFALIKPLMGTLGSMYAPTGIGTSLKTLTSPDTIKQIQELQQGL